MSSINTNISAYYAQNNLRTANAQAQASIARLSSGNKIVSAADDVAGLSIGTILRTTVSTLRTAATNASQGSTLLQVADGALASLGEILQRQKSLAVQANSGTLSDNERSYLNQEFQALKSEYDRIVAKTNFNNVNLLDGTLSTSGSIKTQAPSAIVAVAQTGQTVTTTVIPGGAGGFVINTVGDDTTKLIGSLAGANVTISDDVAGDDNGTLTLEINGVVYQGALGALDSDTGNTNLVLTEITDGRAGFVATIIHLDVGADIGGFGATPTQAQLNTIAETIEGEVQKLDLYQTKAISKTAGQVGAIIDETTALATNAGTILQGLDGDDFTLKSASFDATGNAPSVGGFEVDYANGGATVRATINGVTYEKELLDLVGLKTATNGGTNSIVLVNVDDASSTFSISFAALDGDITIDSSNVAKKLEDALNEIFGSGSAGGLSFQVGTDSADTIGISVSNIDSASVYKDADGATQDLDISTQAGAVTASDVLDIAIKTVTSTRADVGALQSRFSYASATLSTSIQNLDAARGQFLDTDVSAESTRFATQQVLQQAAISVLAQANQIPQNLLKLIG